MSDQNWPAITCIECGSEEPRGNGGWMQIAGGDNDLVLPFHHFYCSYTCLYRSSLKVAQAWEPYLLDKNEKKFRK